MNQRLAHNHYTNKQNPRIAIVHDWLTNMGGAEKTVLALHKAFPEAPIYTSTFIPENCPEFAKLDIRTTWLQHLPKKLRRWHQLFPVLRAKAFRDLDLSNYDIVISSASAEAKAITVRPDALHICYCHTPTRYYWSHYKDYIKDPGFGRLNNLVRLVAPTFIAWMRKLDLKAVAGVTYFIANSNAVQQRIKKYYNRDSVVIYPPVQNDRFKTDKPIKKEDFYLIVGRQMAYKRFDLAIKACNHLKKRLIVIGNGKEHNQLVKFASPTTQFLTNIDDRQIVEYFQKAKAFIFPQVEDFGIVAAEALAAGTPVIAYSKGGALDIVKDSQTGILFEAQTTESLVNAIKRFETLQFSTKKILQESAKFDEQHFIEQIRNFVTEKSKPS